MRQVRNASALGDHAAAAAILMVTMAQEIARALHFATSKLNGSHYHYQPCVCHRAI